MKALRSKPWIHALVIALGGTKFTDTQFDAAGKPIGQTPGQW